VRALFLSVALSLSLSWSRACALSHSLAFSLSSLSLLLCARIHAHTHTYTCTHAHTHARIHAHTHKTCTCTVYLRWLIHVCDMTHSCVWLDPLVCIYLRSENGARVLLTSLYIQMYIWDWGESPSDHAIYTYVYMRLGLESFWPRYIYICICQIGARVLVTPLYVHMYIWDWGESPCDSSICTYVYMRLGLESFWLLYIYICICQIGARVLVTTLLGLEWSEGIGVRLIECLA